MKISLKKNVIIICVDGGRIHEAQNSSIIKQFSPNSIFFTQSITYAPYTNSSIHALISGAYGSRNGCYSYWHSSRFKHQLFKTLVDYLHDENYPYLIKISDSVEEGYQKLKVKVFRIDYNIFHQNLD